MVFVLQYSYLKCSKNTVVYNIIQYLLLYCLMFIKNKNKIIDNLMTYKIVV